MSEQSSSATTCPLHSSPEAWYDPGCRGCIGGRLAQTERSLAAVNAEALHLREAILDIDAHATPLGEDEDGFVTGGYLISVGCLHRALAATGTAPPCKVCGPESHDCQGDQP